MFDFFKDGVGQFSNIFDCEHVGIGFSYSGEYFFLLELIVEDGQLYAFVVFELSSGEWVSNDDGDGFGHGVVDCSGDEASYFKHGGVGDFFISHDFVLSFFWNSVILH